MPKVKLHRDTVQERIIFRRNLIESTYHSRGYRSQTAVEKALGVSQGWVSHRLRGTVKLDLDDLDKLDKLLRFEASEMAQLVRGNA